MSQDKTSQILRAWRRSQDNESESNRDREHFYWRLYVQIVMLAIHVLHQYVISCIKSWTLAKSWWSTSLPHLKHKNVMRKHEISENNADILKTRFHSKRSHWFEWIQILRLDLTFADISHTCSVLWHMLQLYSSFFPVSLYILHEEMTQDFSNQ